MLIDVKSVIRRISLYSPPKSVTTGESSRARVARKFVLIFSLIQPRGSPPRPAGFSRRAHSRSNKPEVIYRPCRLPRRGTRTGMLFSPFLSRVAIYLALLSCFSLSSTFYHFVYVISTIFYFFSHLLNFGEFFYFHQF